MCYPAEHGRESTRFVSRWPLSLADPMTGYTVHTGSSKKFSQGWDRIFPDAQSPAPPAKKATDSKTVKQPAKKSAKGK